MSVGEFKENVISCVAKRNLHDSICTASLHTPCVTTGVLLHYRRFASPRPPSSLGVLRHQVHGITSGTLRHHRYLVSLLVLYIINSSLRRTGTLYCHKHFASLKEHFFISCTLYHHYHLALLLMTCITIGALCHLSHLAFL